jgi:predicted Zn-dependent protease with MMP-like domain
MNLMDKKDFQQLVIEAIVILPDNAKRAMENVAFVIEGESRRKRANETDVKVNEVLLGLYEGIPKTKRGAGYFGVLPDKITIFQKPIEEFSGGDTNKLKKLINEVVWHEVGHHLGLNEAEIRAVEAKRRKKR